MYGNDNKIDWSRPETYTLTKLSNWTAKRDHFLRTDPNTGDMYIPGHLVEAYTNHLLSAPMWARFVPSKIVFLERLAWLFDGKDPQREQEIIQIFEEEYSYED